MGRKLTTGGWVELACQIQILILVFANSKRIIIDRRLMAMSFSQLSFIHLFVCVFRSVSMYKVNYVMNYFYKLKEITVWSQRANIFALCTCVIKLYYFINDDDQRVT